MEDSEDDIVISNKIDMNDYVNGLCAQIKDKRERKATRKRLLFKLRNKYGDII